MIFGMTPRRGRIRRLAAILAAATLVSSLTVGSASSVFGAKPVTGNPAGDLDQCANGGVGKTPVPCTGSAWQNGNLNGNQAHYNEGESVPYRLRMSNLSTTGSHVVTIEWDTTQSGKHALDYLTSFDRTETTAVPATGSPSTFTIPGDAGVTAGQDGILSTADDIVQAPGVLSLYGGTINSVSAYTVSGTYAGSSATRIAITFAASSSTPTLAWGGHIATRLNWGQNNSAVAINGSPFHMRFIDLDGSGGNQDRSLSNDAVVFPATINIVKNTSPDATTNFAFTPGANLLDGASAATAFNLYDDGTNVGNTKVLSTITFGTNLTVAETDPAPAYALTGACVENMTQDSSFSGLTATIKAQEGETITCTFTNTLQNGTITLTKVVQSNYGGNAGVNDFGLSIGGTSVSSGGSITATPNTPYAINEAGLTGYSFVSISGSGCPQALGGTVTVTGGSSVSCTITNTDIAPTLALTKTVSNTSGGNNPKSEWTLTATPATNTVGATTISGSADVGATGAKSNVVYTLSESTVTGYTNGTTWTCTGTGANQSGNTVTLDEGAVVTCNVTNTDNAPTLALTKTVSNTSGGNNPNSDWTLTATPASGSGFSTISGSADVTATGAKSNVVYTLSESTVTGYTNGTTWTCTDAANADRFTQTATTVTLDEGAAVSCAIANTDIAPTLALDKVINAQFGGGASEDDFVLTAHPTTGPDITDEGGDVSATAAKSNIAYTLSETSLAGYTGGNWSCTGTGGHLVGNVVTLDEGAVVTCSITNSDSKASPSGTTVQKWVLHDTLTITGIRPGGDPGDDATVTFGLYLDDVCSSQVGSDEVVGIASGVAHTSTGVTVTETGFYYWKAVYSGDTYNNSFTTCGAEVTQIQAKDAKGGGRNNLILS